MKRIKKCIFIVLVIFSCLAAGTLYYKYNLLNTKIKKYSPEETKEAGIVDNGGGGSGSSEQINVIFDVNGGDAWTSSTCTSFLATFNELVSSCSKSVTVGGTYGIMPIPTRSGYTFDGWYDTQNTTVLDMKYTADKTVVATQTQRLYAKWTQNGSSSSSSSSSSSGGQLTVIFDVNGGDAWTSSTCTSFLATFNELVSSCSKSVTVGGTYGAMPIPTRSGYTFDGWYDTQNVTALNIKYTGDKTVVATQTQRLYAKWTQNGSSSSSSSSTTNRVTVVFDVNGGDAWNQSSCGGLNLIFDDLSLSCAKMVNVGDAYGTLPTPTRSGYTFDGWYDTQNVTALNIKYTAASTVAAAYGPTQRLYAKWTQNGSSSSSSSTTNRVTVVLDVNGGDAWNQSSCGGLNLIFDDLSLSCAKMVNVGDAYGTLPTPSYGINFKFLGWSDKPGSTTPNVDANTKASSSVTKLYAVWGNNVIVLPGAHPAGYDIVYDPSPGSVPKKTDTKLYDADYTIPDNKASYCDATFVGWNTKKDGSGTTYVAGDKYSTNADLTLYAQYTTDRKYTIKYDANGGEGSADDVEFDSLTSITFAKDEFTKSGHILKSWNTKKDGDGGNYTPGESAKLCIGKGGKTDVTLYAQWEKIEDIEAVLKDIKHKIDGNYIIINPNEDSKKITSGYEKVGSNEEYISTGDKLKTDNKEYIFVVLGDTNGDGVINSADLLNMQKHMLELEELKDAYLKAADADMDGEIKSNDLYVVKIFLLQGINPLK